jgi:RsiW-degrading membrane proteinase PrsW (M82 family)
VLTRLYVGSGRSVLLVALWHTAFNFTTATTATQGLSAAITSTAVMVAAVVVLVQARVRDRAARAARAAERARPGTERAGADAPYP